MDEVEQEEINYMEEVKEEETVAAASVSADEEVKEEETVAAASVSADGSSDDNSASKQVSTKGRVTGPARRSTKGGWTTEEDKKLTDAVCKFKARSWKQIAKCVPNRTDVQCLHRWQKVLNPDLVKGSWTKEEDDLLTKLVAEHGTGKWSEIAKSLSGRIGKQCRERWCNHLKPDIKRTAWTTDEEETIVRAHKSVGNKWAEIAKVLPGRSENAIKNYWNSSLRKKYESDPRYRHLHSNGTSEGSIKSEEDTWQNLIIEESVESHLQSDNGNCEVSREGTNALAGPRCGITFDESGTAALEKTTQPVEESGGNETNDSENVTKLQAGIIPFPSSSITPHKVSDCREEMSNSCHEQPHLPTANGSSGSSIGQHDSSGITHEDNENLVNKYIGSLRNSLIQPSPSPSPVCNLPNENAGIAASRCSSLSTLLSHLKSAAATFKKPSIIRQRKTGTYKKDGQSSGQDNADSTCNSPPLLHQRSIKTDGSTVAFAKQLFPSPQKDQPQSPQVQQHPQKDG